MAKTAADAILFLGMGGAQPGQPDQLGIHLGFFDDERIAGSDGFDLGIGQRGGVHVFEAAHGHVPAHHLGDELGLGFQRLPHIGIERAFGDVAINLHAGISIALPQNPALALLHVGGSPRRVQMMQRNQPFLNIRARTHFLRAAEQHTDLARANGTEQRQLRVVRVVILNEGDFIFRDTQAFQFVGHVTINGKATVLRRGQIAKHKLRQTIILRRLPNLMNFFHGEIHFALRVIRQAGLHQPQIQRGLAAFGGDFEHVVLARVNAPVFSTPRRAWPAPRQTFLIQERPAHCGWPVFPLPVSDA